MRTLSTKFAAAIFALFLTAGFGHAQNPKCTSTSTYEFFNLSSQEEFDELMSTMALGALELWENTGFPMFGLDSEIGGCTLANNSMMVFSKERQMAITWDIAEEKISLRDMIDRVDLLCYDLSTYEKYPRGADRQC